MADTKLTIVIGGNTITIGDVDCDDEIEVKIINGHKQYASIYLDKQSLVSLRNYIDYLLQQLN